MVVTPIPVCTVDEGAIHQPTTIFQIKEQQAVPPQLPSLEEFAAMDMPPPAPNAGAGLSAAPGHAGAANNGEHEAAVLVQHFVANAATAGLGAPTVVDEADTAATHYPCRKDIMEVIDGINCTILQSTAMIGEAIRARGTAVVVAGGTSRAAAATCKLELLLKQHKLANEVGNQLSITHYELMICMMEEKEARGKEGGS